MKSLRFAASAERTLDEIFTWSLENFGLDRALEYQNQILETCQRIAAGTAHSQSCNILAPDDLDTQMRFARSGKHFVIYEELEELIGIVALLHSSGDLGTQLAEIDT